MEAVGDYLSRFLLQYEKLLRKDVVVLLELTNQLNNYTVVVACS